jgi:hypothetical protein
MKKTTLFALPAMVLLFLAFQKNAVGQTQLGAWTFDATPAAPNTPSSVAANLGAQSGTATLYADGTNGSSSWITASTGNELTAFAGSTVNDPRTTPSAGMSYCPIGGTGNSANGKSMVIRFSMTGYQDPILTFATRGTSTGFNTHQWAWSTDNSTYTNFGTNTANTTSTFLVKTLDMSSINGLDQAATVYLRITFSGATSSSGNNRLDNIVINATAASAGGPTKLAITTINAGNSPSASTPFNVVVQSQDASNAPANVTANTGFTLSVTTGSGSLGGTITGTITAGTNTATVTGVTYNLAETGVSLTATRTSGDALSPGTSNTFTVLTAADHLTLVNTPAYGQVGVNLNTFTVEARRSDNTVDANYTSSIAVSKATGSGNLSGTLSKTPVYGVATFNDLQLDAAGTYTLNATSGSLTSATSGNIEVFSSLSYRSKISGAWNSAATWEAGSGSSWFNSIDVPTNGTRDVLIRNGHAVNVPLSYNSGTGKNLTVENGATLYANSATGSCFVYVYGNILNDGTIGGATDVIGFDIEGTSCQLSGTGTFNVSRIAKFTTTNAVTNFSINQDVTLSYTSATAAALRNNTTTTTFNITLETGKKLTVPNAKIDLTYCTLTLKDNASLIDNGTIAGMTSNVAVERFLTKYNNIGDDMFHFLSSPVATQAIQPGFVSLPNNTDDFYSWDETTNTWINSSNNSGAWNSSFESNFLVGKGYLVAYPSDVTKTFTGALNTGTLNSGSGLPAVSYTSGMGNGWNLMGNPYPSSIDWDKVLSAQLTNIDNAVYVYENATSTYKSYVAGVGSLTDGIIPPTQGFFIHANNAGTPAFYLENQDRVHSSAGFYKNDPVQNIVRLKLEGNGKTDETFIRFIENSTSGFDKEWDAFKLPGGNSVPTLYSTSGNTKLSVNSLPVDAMEGFVPVSVEPVSQGTYTIRLTENTLPNATYVTLEDIKTGSLQRMNDNPVYSFEASGNDDPARFKLHFKDATSVADPATSVDFSTTVLQGQLSAFSSIDGLITLSDMTGRIITSGKINKGNTMKFDLEGHSGIYLVTLSSLAGKLTNKVIVK